MNRSASTRSKHERQLPLPAALVDRNHSPSTRRQIGWILLQSPLLRGHGYGDNRKCANTITAK